MKSKYILWYISLAFISACGDSSTESGEASVNSEAEVPAEMDNYGNSDDSAYYAWVKNLNIRSKASTNEEVVATVQPQDPLTLVEVGNTKEEIVLRGVLYHEPWLKVKTPDGKEGWVFGGAVKSADEQKGNAPITDTDFSFPYFGQFDLSEWKKRDTQAGDGEGDFDTETSIYQLGDQILEIYTYNGEYAYGYDYTLKTKSGQLLKERKFRFSNDIREIEEVVKDHSSDSPREYSRKQKTGKSAFQLNAKPRMVNGTWTEKALSVEDNKTSGRLGIVSLGDCRQVDSDDTGCSCGFRMNKDDYKSSVFISDYGQAACITIDGKTEALEGSWQSHANLAERDIWIVMNDGSSTLFGNPVNLADYDDTAGRLVQALLSLDKIPDEIPIENNTTAGMAIREVRDMCNDAIDTARKLRRVGERGYGAYFSFASDTFTVIIEADVDKSARSDSGTAYVGEMTVITKDGTLVDQRKVWGHCGC